MGALIVIFFAFILPALIICVNTWKIVSYYRRIGRYIKVDGRVTGNVVQKGSGRHSPSHFSPIIEFLTKDNVEIKAIYSQDNPDRPLYGAGEPVTICYHPDEPKRFLIYDPKAEFLVAGVCILIGLLWLVFAVIAIWF